MAGTQVPTVYLSRLLKELWNYWFMCSRGDDVIDEYCGLSAWKVVVGVGRGHVPGTLLGPEAIRRGADTVPDVLFLVWCLRIVEWMRASLWSSC